MIQHGYCVSLRFENQFFFLQIQFQWSWKAKPINEIDYYTKRGFNQQDKLI